MLGKIRVSSKELIFALSEIFDLAAPELSQHQLRTAYTSWRIAQAMNLELPRQRNLLVAALFHDVGALSIEEKVQLVRHEEPKPNRHCIIGEFFFNLLPLLRPCKAIVRQHHTPWSAYNGSLYEDSNLESQILCLADVLDVYTNKGKFILEQADELKELIASQCGTQFHPDVVEGFEEAARQPAFWLEMDSPTMGRVLRSDFPFDETHIEGQALLALSALMRRLIDFKSHFTATHSAGVACAARYLAELAGFRGDDLLAIEVAGNLHDIGKLAVSNSLLEKNGPLTEQERLHVKQHPYHTRMRLRGVKGLENVIDWASYHHEKLDGSGYPFGLSGEDLGTEARIIAVADIFTALNEDRPYRSGMQKDEVNGILQLEVRAGHIDPTIVDLLRKNFDACRGQVLIVQAQAQEEYEQMKAQLSAELERIDEPLLYHEGYVVDEISDRRATVREEIPGE